MIVVGISVSLLRIVHGVPDDEPSAVLAMGERKFERRAAPGEESTAARRSRGIGFAQTLVEDHAADDLVQPPAAVFLSHQQTIGTTPTACIRFAY